MNMLRKLQQHFKFILGLYDFNGIALLSFKSVRPAILGYDTNRLIRRAKRAGIAYGVRYTNDFILFIVSIIIKFAGSRRNFDVPSHNS